MNVVTSAIFTALSASSELTSRLSTYNSNPAIFSGDEVPVNAVAPWVYISPSITDEHDDTKTYNGRSLTVDIGIWSERGNGSKDLEEIAEIVRGLLHRDELSISGYDLIECVAGGPIGVTGDNLIGRVILLQLTIAEA